MQTRNTKTRSQAKLVLPCLSLSPHVRIVELRLEGSVVKSFEECVAFVRSKGVELKSVPKCLQNSNYPLTGTEWHESTFSNKIMNIARCAPGLYGFSGSLSVGRLFQPCLESVLMLWTKTCSQTCSMLKSYLVCTSNTLPMISSRSFWACAFWCFILEFWNKMLNGHPGLEPCKLPSGRPSSL